MSNANLTGTDHARSHTTRLRWAAKRWAVDKTMVDDSERTASEGLLTLSVTKCDQIIYARTSKGIQHSACQASETMDLPCAVAYPVDTQPDTAAVTVQGTVVNSGAKHRLLVDEELNPKVQRLMSSGKYRMRLPKSTTRPL